MTKRAGVLFLIAFILSCYLFRKHLNWSALAAIGTISAVIWAIYHQGILAWINRPTLEIVGPYELEPPHLRRVPITDQKGSEVDISYQLSIQIENTGKAIAKSAQPLVSGMGRLVDEKWEVQANWIAAPIRWALDIAADIGGDLPTEERDLIPHRPYVFNFGSLRADSPSLFLLNTIAMPGNQDRVYKPGEFCFECKVFAEGADPVKKYFHIKWHGGFSREHEDVREIIQVHLEDRPPW
jgi:hypothetical protein